MRQVALVFVVLFTLACPPPCDRSNCTGCCDSTGECLAGTSRNFCGKGGVVCGTCPSPGRCMASMCVQPVDAGPPDAGPIVLNCAAGCRVEAECQPGNLPEACGADGGVCTVCAAGTRCEAGRCISTRCFGCFDALGTCQRGLDNLACGLDGGVCQGCSPGNACQPGGVCAAVGCSRTTCSMGCCQAGLCQLPSANTCGSMGGACTVCAAGRTCVGGLCR